MRPLADIETQTDLTGSVTSTVLALQVVARLADLYVGAGYGPDPEAFREKHFRPMYHDATVRARELEQQLYARLQAEHPIDSLDLLVLSCAYCVDVIRAGDSLNVEDTWLHASFAQYWLGFASGSRLAIGAGAVAVSENAKAASRARDENRAKVRAKAREIAASRPFANKTEAARAALPEVTALAKKYGLRYSEDRAIKAIVEWLRGMTFEDDVKS